jgi:hypothetical protein
LQEAGVSCHMTVIISVLTRTEEAGRHVPREEHLLKPSSVMTAARMKTKGRRAARMRTVWNTVR